MPTVGHARAMTARGQLFAAAGLIVVLVGACRAKPDPIRIDRGYLVVENFTHEDWRDVRVVVNAYYHGGARALAAGGRLEGPLGSFVTGLGQRFDPSRERIREVEVRATTASGRPVALDWTNERRRR
jgi:hypothetical protein